MELGYNAVRLFFTKEGRCIYISHLDLNRAMDRALVRSALPVWHTMGFNPHIYTTFALPLSLGTAGICETMDFKLREDIGFDVAVEMLNKALPEGIKAKKIDIAQMDPKEIMWADYEVIIFGDALKLKKDFEELLLMKEITVEKRSKKGIKEIDIRPMLDIMALTGENERTIAMKLRCRAGVEINLNPSLVLEAAKKYFGSEWEKSSITRVDVLNEELLSFK